jgi:superkiller protein 3
MTKACASLAVGLLLLTASAARADKKVDDAVAKAEDQYLKGKPEEAVKTLQKVADQNPASPEAFLGLGRMQARTGNLDDASKAFNKAADLATNSPAVRGQALAALVDLDLRQGTGEQALAHAEQAVKIAADNPAALAALARAQARAGSAAQAVETAQKAVQAGSTPVTQAALGEALLAQHRGADAAAAFQKALELDAKLVQARVGLALAHLDQNKAADAVTEAKKATDQAPNSGEAWAVLGLATLAQNSNAWNEAIQHAQQGAFLEPRSPAVQVAVGKIFEAAGNLDQAAVAYGKATDVDPKYVPAQAALVQVLVRRGNLDQALAAAQKLVAAAPQSAEGQLQLGAILLRKEDYAGAADALEKATKLNPQSAEAFALLGTAYQYDHQPADALTAYTRAVELAPNNINYHVTHGLLLGVNEQYQPAIAELQKVVNAPGYHDVAGWVNLGWVDRNAEPPRTEEAINAYKKALEIDPKSVPAALGLGWAFARSRLWDQAIASFKHAMELDPKVAPEAYNGMGWAYFFKKDIPQARANLDKALAAGRADARLKGNIEKVEKLLAQGQAAQAAAAEIEKAQGPGKEEKPQGPDLAVVVQDTQSQNPAVRRRGARQLGSFGAQGVPYVKPLLRDSNLDVREAAVDTLAKLGPAAKDAAPDLLQLASERPPVIIAPTPAQVQEEMHDSDVRRKAREVYQKLQGGH